MVCQQTYVLVLQTLIFIGEVLIYFEHAIYTAEYSDTSVNVTVVANRLSPEDIKLQLTTEGKDCSFVFLHEGNDL